MHNDGWHEAAALYNLIKKLLVAALCVKAWCCRFEYGGKDLITLAITDIGDFTRKLLIQNVFDQFYVLEGEVSTFAAFTIDGELNEDYYSSDETELLQDRKWSLWSEIKPVAFLLMKGKKLPVSFKFVLQLSDHNTDWLLDKYHLEHLKEQLSGLYLNIRYQDKKLICVTGLSYKTFVMDKTLEHVWDDTAAQFMKQNGITVEKV